MCLCFSVRCFWIFIQLWVRNNRETWSDPPTKWSHIFGKTEGRPVKRQHPYTTNHHDEYSNTNTKFAQWEQEHKHIFRMNVQSLLMLTQLSASFSTIAIAIFFFAWFSRRETMWTCIFVVEAKTRLAEENGMENSVFRGLSRTKHWPESERTHKQWTLSIELYVQHKGRVRSVYLQHLFFVFKPTSIHSS